VNEQIQVGDLVVIAKPRRCGCNEVLGHIFTLTNIWHDIQNMRCPTCGSPVDGTSYAWLDGMNKSCELWRLRRIPPLSELESTKHENSVPA
jgi:hypothetical protein